MSGQQVLRRFVILILFVLCVTLFSYLASSKKAKYSDTPSYAEKKHVPITEKHPPYERYGVLGIPKISEEHTILYNIGYVVAFSEKHRIPLWCSYRLSEVVFPDEYKRYSSWHSDPRVKGSPDPKDYDYKISKKHRGHLAPSFAMNRSYGTIGMIESFYMTNATPMSEKLNTGIWAELENNIFGAKSSWANIENETWVICGPILGETPKAIGKKITLPKEYFKIILLDANNKRIDEDNFKVIAFRFPEEGVEKKFQLKDFLCSIDSIEESTGIDFFSELADPKEEEIEAKIPLDIWK